MLDAKVANVDSLRLEVNGKLDPTKKGELGQFMTPSHIAEFMGSLFDTPRKRVRLLDCGAGIGSLTISAVQKLKEIESVDLWEIDSIMREYLAQGIESLHVPFEIHPTDFIQDAVRNVVSKTGRRFTHAILNPPYKKISTASKHRLLLRAAGIETVNLYTAFLALTILLMESDGQVVAIVPRSFCNGPYYKPFRKLMLQNCSIEHIHVFDSRSKAFKDDEVLQENVIFKLKKDGVQSDVTISTSHDHNLTDYVARSVEFSEIVKPTDEEMFIHIPLGDQAADAGALFTCGLTELHLEVCTGPVVDFRLKDYWLRDPTKNSVPLLYPHHFEAGQIVYPKEHKKPNALKRHPEVDKWLMPNGYYVVVKRFSSKEERRRVVAYNIDPNEFKTEVIGFENHWNVFHFKKSGIDRILSNGLACFLNSTLLDEHFRIFSGHTQVNATDLRNMKYPTLKVLRQLGMSYRPTMNQEQIDELIESRT
jgi:adenine-specific DNA-methyltransferase